MGCERRWVSGPGWGWAPASAGLRAAPAGRTPEQGACGDCREKGVGIPKGEDKPQARGPAARARHPAGRSWACLAPSGSCRRPELREMPRTLGGGSWVKGRGLALPAAPGGRPVLPGPQGSPGEMGTPLPGYVATPRRARACCTPLGLGAWHRALRSVCRINDWKAHLLQEAPILMLKT